ncbi:MAG: fumarylacetoacetate hydrolase family protein [Bacteroidales bacterium]|nr:fumarylacetoacetate hydrolase family protein [Bacteroidales bacterium]
MKVLCVGRNYVEHIEELGNEKPDSIVFFLKPDTALSHNNDDFYLPDFSEDVHYECEVVVKIDKVGKTIPVEYAHEYYSEIALGLDMTLRDVQQKAKEKGLPWTLAKGFDYSAPISNFLPLSEFGKIQDLDFSLQKNGAIVQQANTKQMIHTVDEIIAYISQYITLKKGDLIFTGTPKGVGKVNIGDKFVGYIGEKEMFSINVK